MEMGEDGGGVWRGRCDAGGGACLLTNKTPVILRPAEARAIKAVAQSVD